MAETYTLHVAGLTRELPICKINDDLSIDWDAWADEVTWLAANGMDGVTPNGSLGEYQTLTPEERYRVVSIATEVAPEGFRVREHRYENGRFWFASSENTLPEDLPARIRALFAKMGEAPP